MVRIGKKEIPSNKNILIGLTSIYGISRSSSEQILKDCHINPYTKSKNLDEKQLKNISQVVGKYIVEEKLTERIEKNIDNQIKLGTYHGLRRLRKLPIHGQRTRHNAQTAKKGGAATRKKIAVAGKKKAPSPK